MLFIKREEKVLSFKGRKAMTFGGIFPLPEEQTWPGTKFLWGLWVFSLFCDWSLMFLGSLYLGNSVCTYKTGQRYSPFELLKYHLVEQFLGFSLPGLGAQAFNPTYSGG